MVSEDPAAAPLTIGAMLDCVPAGVIWKPGHTQTACGVEPAEHAAACTLERHISVLQDERARDFQFLGKLHPRLASGARSTLNPEPP